MGGLTDLIRDHPTFFIGLWWCLVALAIFMFLALVIRYMHEDADQSLSDERKGLEALREIHDKRSEEL